MDTYIFNLTHVHTVILCSCCSDHGRIGFRFIPYLPCFTESQRNWPLQFYQVSRSPDSVSVGSLGPGVHKILVEPSKHFWGVWGLILNAILPLLPSCWGFSFALGCGVSFFHGIQHSPVYECSVMSYNFGVLAGEHECTSFYSAILCLSQTCVRVSCRCMGQQ